MAGTAFAFNWSTAGDPSYTARQLRQMMVSPFVAIGSAARPLGAKSGIRVGTPGSIAAVVGTGPYTYAVQPFVGVIDAESNAGAAPYTYAFAAAETGNINPAGGVLRVDSLDVVLSDKDEGDSSGARTVQLVYTAGAATGSLPPSAPARSHRVAYINVPTAGAPTISWVPEWSGDPGEWTFNTYAEVQAYVTKITATNVPPQQQATVLADPTPAYNGFYSWSGSAFVPAPGAVRFKASILAATALTGLVNIPYSTIVEDTHSAWNSTNKNWVAPFAGTYMVVTDLKQSTAVAFCLKVMKNGTSEKESGNAQAIANSLCSVTEYLPLAAGDTIAIQPNTGVSATASPGTAHVNTLEIVRIA
ncbi:hypothetical protein HII28_02220 [Planctomonas sp. JC2975]|uniref:hypothetical protein n=1 Tax=Planctomonas sp. JC2975 TaxID=2729626 RepID=UPI0014732DBE|nr:hypothetical protein [Planctomonas sp. JC2975]NNC10703.1 hypothetical protein [Planctomonas sp. JC2975]